MSTEEYNLFSATEITFTGSVASADTIVFSNAGTVTAISSVENYTLAAAGNTITGLAACSETFTPTGGTNVVNLGTHTAADSVNVTTNAFETITGFGSSTGTVNDELLVTGTGDALAHTFPINETMHAQDTAALTAASGYVFVDSQAGVTLTAASVAALFSSTQSAGKWAIQHPSFGTQTELLIGTGSTTSDTLWQITESSSGVFTAVQLVGVTVAAGHPVTFANLH